MSQSIAKPPIRSQIHNNGIASPEWANFYNQQYNYLRANLSPNGYVFPPFTTAQRDKLPNVAEGTTILNTTTSKVQSFVGGKWNDLH